MLGPNDLPFAVAGMRVLILEKAPKDRTEGGLHIPDVAKIRYWSGVLLDAGLQARDILHDNGFKIGDEVEFGQYAGLREVWDRVVEGDHSLPDDSYSWGLIDSVAGVQKRYKCSKTGAIRAMDSIIVLNVDDLIASVELAARIRNGAARYKLGKTSDGKTQHFIERSE